MICRTTPTGSPRPDAFSSFGPDAAQRTARRDVNAKQTKDNEIMFLVFNFSQMTDFKLSYFTNSIATPVLFLNACKIYAEFLT